MIMTAKQQTVDPHGPYTSISTLNLYAPVEGCLSFSDVILVRLQADLSRGTLRHCVSACVSACQGTPFTSVLIVQVTCLNESEPGAARRVFRPWGERLDMSVRPLESNDDDPELLIHVPFDGNVKIKVRHLCKLRKLLRQISGFCVDTLVEVPYFWSEALLAQTSCSALTWVHHVLLCGLFAFHITNTH